MGGGPSEREGWIRREAGREGQGTVYKKGTKGCIRDKRSEWDCMTLTSL